MGIIQTFKGFHWVTKIVIALTVLLLGLLIAAAAVQVYWMAHQTDDRAFAAGQGLGYMVIALAMVLVQVLPIIVAIIIIYMAAMAIKTWIEKYLDAVIAKLDILVEEKAGHDGTRAAVISLNEKFSRMEQKLDNIEKILEKVGE